MPEYLELWMSLQGKTFRGYAVATVERFKVTDRGVVVSQRTVHNVMTGAVRDWSILKAISDVIADHHGTQEIMDKEFNLKSA